MSDIIVCMSNALCAIYTYIFSLTGFSSHFIGKFYPPVAVPDLRAYNYTDGENFICSDDVI